jgi:hypothetical protein
MTKNKDHTWSYGRKDITELFSNIRDYIVVGSESDNNIGLIKRWFDYAKSNSFEMDSELIQRMMFEDFKKYMSGQVRLHAKTSRVDFLRSCFTDIIPSLESTLYNYVNNISAFISQTESLIPMRFLIVTAIKKDTGQLEKRKIMVPEYFTESKISNELKDNFRKYLPKFKYPLRSGKSFELNYPSHISEVELISVQNLISFFRLEDLLKFMENNKFKRKNFTRLLTDNLAKYKDVSYSVLNKELLLYNFYNDLGILDDDRGSISPKEKNITDLERITDIAHYKIYSRLAISDRKIQKFVDYFTGVRAESDYVYDLLGTHIICPQNKLLTMRNKIRELSDKPSTNNDALTFHEKTTDKGSIPDPYDRVKMNTIIKTALATEMKIINNKIASEEITDDDRNALFYGKWLKHQIGGIKLESILQCPPFDRFYYTVLGHAQRYYAIRKEKMIAARQDKNVLMFASYLDDYFSALILHSIV